MAAVASGLQGTEIDEAFRPPVIPAGAQEGHGEIGRLIPLRNRAPPFPEPQWREFIEDIIGLVNAERQNPVVFAQDTAPSHT